MLDVDLGSVPTRDLPVCFPGRWCIDEPPFGADLINATTPLTPSSPAIAAVSFTVLGAAVVLVGIGLRTQWRGSGTRPWLVVLAVASVLVGLFGAQAVGARLDSLSAIYSDVYGQPSESVPPALIGSWPSVLVAGYSIAVVGALALFLTLNTAVMLRRRDARREDLD